MSNSLYSGLIRYQASFFAANDGMDTCMARTIANNVSHYADSCGQVVCNWVDNGSNPELSTAQESSLGTPFHIFTFPPFPLKMRPDGESYRIRFRINARSTRSTGGVNQYFYVALTATSDGNGAAAYVNNLIDGYTATNVVRAETSSSTAAWLSVTTPILYLPRADLSQRGTITENSGTGININHVEGVISVWGAAHPTNGIATQRGILEGLYAAEYIGT